MQDNIMWQVFKDTGDPLCWLMYRAERDKDNDTAGDKPRPSD